MSVDFFDQRLASLKADLKVYGKEIVDHVTSLYGINAPDSRFELKNDAFSMLNVLQIDVAEIVKEAQERNEFKAKHSSEIEECTRLSNLLTQISHIVDRITECEGLVNKISLIPACKAIEQISHTLDRLPGPNTEIGSGTVCTLLNKENKLLHCRLTAKLHRILNECVHFEYGRISVHTELKGVLRSEDTILEHPVKLADLWTAINLCNRTDEAVDHLLKALWTHVVRPLWREKRAAAPRVNRAEEHCAVELLLDSILRDGKAFDAGSHNSANNGTPRNPFSDLGPCKMPLPQLLDCLAQVFTFLYSDILCRNEQVAECVAAKLSAAPINLMQTLIECVSHQLPKTEPELALFRRTLEAPCRILELSMRNCGFLPGAATDGDGAEHSGHSGPLSDFISDLPSIFADLRRREILKAAREVVLSDYHNTMLAAGDAAEDELSSAGDVGDYKAALELSVSFTLQRLKFDACQTSLAACRLLKLVHEVMKQASSPSASPTVAHTLFQSARDCLELFMAIVPMQFADTIHTPRMSAVFYNDCIYIAHNCTLLTHKYRHEMGKIDPVLLNTVGFMDFIPRFRQLGDGVLSRQLEVQRVSLLELVGNIHISADGDSNTSSSARYATASTAALPPPPHRATLLSGGLALAEKISTKIGTKLSTIGSGGSAASGNMGSGSCNNDDAAVLVRRHMERLSSQWLGVLQDGVYTRLLGHLLEYVLREAMRPILLAECISESAGADVSRVYRSLQGIRLLFPSTAEGNSTREDEALLRVCGSWRKFTALTDLLEYSLADVAEWLPRKKFASFTGSEVTALIKALFEDSPRRQTLLASILEMSS